MLFSITSRRLSREVIVLNYTSKLPSAFLLSTLDEVKCAFQFYCDFLAKVPLVTKQYGLVANNLLSIYPVIVGLELKPADAFNYLRSQAAALTSYASQLPILTTPHLV